MTTAPVRVRSGLALLAVMWTMAGASVVLLACCLPLTADRLRPA